MSLCKPWYFWNKFQTDLFCTVQSETSYWKSAEVTSLLWKYYNLDCWAAWLSLISSRQTEKNPHQTPFQFKSKGLPGFQSLFFSSCYTADGRFATGWTAPLLQKSSLCDVCIPPCFYFKLEFSRLFTFMVLKQKSKVPKSRHTAWDEPISSLELSNCDPNSDRTRSRRF